MPRTDNQKAVTAYLSLELYDRLKDFKIDEGLKSDSQAIAAILERFFRHTSSDSTDKHSDNTPRLRLERAEAQIKELAHTVESLKLILSGEAYTNARETGRGGNKGMSTVKSNVLGTADSTADSTVDSDVLGTADSTADSTVDSDVLGTVDSTVDSAVLGTVDSTVDSAVLGTVDSDVLGTVDSDVLGTVDSAVLGTVDSTVDSPVLGTSDSDVLGTSDSDVLCTVDSDVLGTVDSDVLGTVDSDVLGTVDSDVLGTVDSTVDSAVLGTVDSTVDSAVLGTVDSTVDSAVLGTSDSTVDSAVLGTGDSDVPSKDDLFIVCLYHISRADDPVYWHSYRKGFISNIELAKTYKSEGTAYRQVQNLLDDLRYKPMPEERINFKDYRGLRAMKARLMTNADV